MINSQRYELRDLLKINNGKDYKSLSKGNVPIYGSGGIMGYTSQSVSDDESILLPRKGTLDNIIYVEGNFWTVDTMYWTTINKNIAYPKYLYCYLSLLDLSKKNSGSTLPSMTFDAYYDVPINLPDMAIQKKVGDMVFNIINKIKLNNSIISELEEMAKEIYDYWFVQFDFPDENVKPYKSSGGKMVMNEELGREIPEGWEVKTIGDISSRVKVGFVGPVDKYYCNNSEGYPIVRPAEMGNNGISYSTLRHITEYFYDKNKKSQVNRGNILISRCGKDGIPNIYESDEKAQVLNAVIIEQNLNVASSEFLNETIKSVYIQKQISNYTSGSIQAVINTEMIAKLKLAFDKEVAKGFTNTVLPMYSCIRKKRKENQELVSLRDYLLPLLMNGQVTFSDQEGA